MGRGEYSRVSLDGWGQCAKYLLFVFNLLVLIGGLAIAIIGIIAVASDDYYRFQDFEDNNLFRSAAFIQIVVGFLVVLFAFLGCCGAIRESKSLLLTYATLTMIMFILLMVAGILAIVYKSDAKDLIRDRLRETMKNYGAGGEDQATKSWDALQKEGKCCGVDSYTDWAAINGNFNPTTNMFPPSCCRDVNRCSASQSADAWDQGCVNQVDKILSFSSTLSWVAIVIAVVMLVGVILAFCVGCAL